jgi:hypothetical protein
MSHNGQIDVSNKYNNIIDNINKDNSSLNNIGDKNVMIDKKQLILTEMKYDIESKEKLLLTRSRMLQISTDRNSYKQKLIYFLIGFIISIFIIFIIIYVFLKKTKNKK